MPTLTNPQKTVLARRVEAKKARWRSLIENAHFADTGTVTFDEFSALLMGATESKQLFDALDVDDSGVLDVHDIRAFADQK